jgi:transposase
MEKRYIVNLTRAEREGLEQLVMRERVSGLKRLRASILLKADDELTDVEVAEELDVDVRTVARVRQRCVERGVAESMDRKPQVNPSRPRKFDGEAEARLVQLACSQAPDGRSGWTLALLADKLVELKVFESVSRSAICRVLKKTRPSPG